MSEDISKDAELLTKINELLIDFKLLQGRMRHGEPPIFEEIFKTMVDQLPTMVAALERLRAILEAE